MEKKAKPKSKPRPLIPILTPEKKHAAERLFKATAHNMYDPSEVILALNEVAIAFGLVKHKVYK